MRYKPDQLIFETEEDVINYITKGVVPNKSDAYEVFSAIRSPGTSLIQLNFSAAQEDPIRFAEIMEQVYENVREMQIAAGVGCAMSGLLGFVLGRRFH